MTLEFRDYQFEAIAAIHHDWQECGRVLAVMATGTGKTHTFLGALDRARREGTLTRALIIAHRRELISQPLERMRDYFPALHAQSGAVMAEHDETAAQVVVATVQTLSSPARLARLLAHGPFSHVVVDECHHATAETYRRLLANFPGANVLGVTATPLRTDGDGLARVFERVSYRLPISAAIRRGALVPFDALGVALPVSLAGIRETKDGWERESLGDILRAENVLQIVLEHWRQYAAGRRTIAFTASVAQARRTAEYFRGNGLSAEWVSGETPAGEREAILARFQSGKTQIVCNCMVLTEGFDAPETSAVLMIAPTKSDLIYTQRLGRGLRTASGKTNCLVIDFAPQENRNVVMAGDVLGQPREVKQAREKAERGGVLALSVNALGEAAAIDPASLVVRVLNLLRRDALAWTVDGTYVTAALSEKESLCIVLPDPDRLAQGEAQRREGRFGQRETRLFEFLSQCRLYRLNGAANFAGAYPSFDAAKAAADELVLDNLDPALARKKQAWRKEPPTGRQEKFLRSLGVAELPQTKGQAAQLITHVLAKRGAAQADRREQLKQLKGMTR